MSFEITDLQGSVELSNGTRMPYFGLGVYKAVQGDEVIKACQFALDHGYRLIDTAAFYNNEEGVGHAVRNTDLERSEVFITSKLWNNDQGFDNTLYAFDATMNKLGLDYLDLYLIHWPIEGLYVESWKALERIYHEGRVKAIGVSNFMVSHLKALLAEAEVSPMVNQVEFSPRLVQQPLLDYCAVRHIQVQSWRTIMKGKVNEIEELVELARNYQKSPVQLVLRWNLQKGVLVIPKSVTPERILSNADVFDFELSADDMRIIDGLDQGLRMGPNPFNPVF